ncbi:hypothetical protein GEN90_24870 [Vibrio parahaemolyticus]|nr:hypothetical protein [Vibrio parahaemolyticus]
MKGAQQVLPGSGSMGPTDRFIKIVLDELSGVQVDIDAQEYIKYLAANGAERLSYDSLRTLEAEDNFKLFAREVKLRVLQSSGVVGVTEIKFALAFLCPLFPIC